VSLGEDQEWWRGSSGKEWLWSVAAEGGRGVVVERLPAKPGLEEAVVGVVLLARGRGSIVAARGGGLESIEGKNGCVTCV
jgi:hypothetical protein